MPGGAAFSHERLLLVVILALLALQSGLQLLDELRFHRRRGLARIEGWSHASDAFLFGLIMGIPAFWPPAGPALTIYLIGAVLSLLLVTKDEWIHARECTGTELWLHALMFIIHPLLLAGLAVLWLRSGSRPLFLGVALLALGWAIYQLAFWVIGADRRRLPGRHAG
jgi:hypothetical protein